MGEWIHPLRYESHARLLFCWGHTVHARSQFYMGRDRGERTFRNGCAVFGWSLCKNLEYIELLTVQNSEQVTRLHIVRSRWIIRWIITGRRFAPTRLRSCPSACLVSTQLCSSTLTVAVQVFDAISDFLCQGDFRQFRAMGNLGYGMASHMAHGHNP